MLQFPIYGALHFIPMLLFKRHQFLKEPLRMFLKAMSGTARSSTFLGMFVITYQSMLFGRPYSRHYINVLKYSLLLHET